MEYKEWLKGQIKNANELAEKYAKEKEFGTAYMYLAKVTAFEECLAELEKQEQGVRLDIRELKVESKYVLFAYNEKSRPFTVIGIHFDIFDRYCVDVRYENDNIVHTYYENDGVTKWYERAE